MALLAGFGITAMGLGLIPVDTKIGPIAKVYTDPLNLPLRPFLFVVGVTKILSALKLWNIGPVPTYKLAFIGLAAPAASALYGHAKIEGAAGAISPAIYLALLGTLFYMDEGATKSKTS